MLPSLSRSGFGEHEDLARGHILLYLKNKVPSNLIHNNQKGKKDNNILCDDDNDLEELYA